MIITPSNFVPLLSPQAAERSLRFVFRGGELLIRQDSLALPDPATCDAFAADCAALPVGLLGDTYCDTVWIDADRAPIDGYSFSGLRRLFGAMDEQLLAIAGRAFQIAEWARTHRYCGACGIPTERVAGERCLRCPACGQSSYPRISPAMMTLVKRGNEILLARHAASPTNRYTALAGFLESGESIEDAIHREVFEEVGLRVENLRYFGSQSWPFPHSLMIAFTAEYAGGEIRLDQSEIADARWFGPGDEMPEIPPPGFSIASALIGANLPRR